MKTIKHLGSDQKIEFDIDVDVVHIVHIECQRVALQPWLRETIMLNLLKASNSTMDAILLPWPRNSTMATQ